MTTINLGKIKPLYKGDYSAGTTYRPLDFTMFNGALYVNKVESTGNPPSNPSFFDIINVTSTASWIAVTPVGGISSTDVQAALAELDQDISLRYGPGNIVPISSGGTGVTSAGAARVALGASVVGDSVFTAPTQNDAQIALGASLVGRGLITAPSASMARASLSAGVVGDSLFTAATPEAARAVLEIPTATLLEMQTGTEAAIRSMSPKLVWDAILTGSSTPAGMVIHIASTAAPVGYLKANGALVSRATYSALFAVCGTLFGVGDGSTTFALPDLRGEFIRAWDDGRGVDAGRTIGSAQAGGIQSHSHTFNTNNSYNVSVVAGGPSIKTVGPAAQSITDVTGGGETRPMNIALLACIKY